MSHHYSGPDLGFPMGDARLDFCDLYAFPKPGDAGRSILIMNFHPSSTVSVDLSPQAKPLELTTAVPFNPNAVYEIRMDTDGDKVADVTFSVAFSPFSAAGQSATLRLVKHTQGAADTTEVLIDDAAVSVDAAAETAEGAGYRMFAGWRSDPFFFDPPGAFNGFQFIGGKDFFANKDVCSIVLDVPNTVFGSGTVNLWARVMLQTDAGWIQVDRGAAAAQSVFLTNDQRERYLATEPAHDDSFIDVFGHSLEHLGGYAHDEAKGIAKSLLPDVLPFDPTKAASYPHNGRTLTNDVMGIFLPIISNKRVPGHGLPPHRDLLDDFPYVAPPHTAFAKRPAP